MVYLYCSVGIFIFFIVISCLVKKCIYIKKQKAYISSGISVVDKMEGVEFEKFLLAHFEKQGYKGKVTQAGHDYGADLVLKKNGVNIVVQAKRYKKSVGISAIQQIVASLKYYRASKGIVVSNSTFTKSAITLALANNIEIWDRKTLISLMNKNNSKNQANKIIEDTNKNMVCPLCKSALVIKNGKYGKFLACLNYPKCKFTRS